jgi:hypothetical protein
MSGKEQFIKLPRDVLESAVFGSLGINGFRVVRFLMIEHMRRGGRQNGNLKAPCRQLVAFGIAPRHVTAAIGEAEESGLVVCHRHGLRIATTYELTWLPLHDGSTPSNAWREFRKPGNLPTESEAGLPTEGKADGSKLPTEGKAEPSGNLPTEGKALYRSSYQGSDSLKEEGGYGTEVSAEAVRSEAEQPNRAEKVIGAGVASGGDTPICRWPLGTGCAKPALPGQTMCARHG